MTIYIGLMQLSTIVAICPYSTQYISCLLQLLLTILFKVWKSLNLLIDVAETVRRRDPFVTWGQHPYPLFT